MGPLAEPVTGSWGINALRQGCFSLSALQRSALQFTLGNTPLCVTVLDRINALMGGCRGWKLPVLCVRGRHWIGQISISRIWSRGGPHKGICSSDLFDCSRVNDYSRLSVASTEKRQRRHSGEENHFHETAMDNTTVEGNVRSIDFFYLFIFSFP